MGLIRAAMGAAGGVMADQWKEYFYCEAMPADLLATRGWKRQSGRSANTKGSDNIITNGSIVAVADGQCAMIVEQGKVVDMCAEPGEYTYDTGSAPSLFSGDLSDSIGAVFQNIGKRFTFGGEAPMDQRIYYFNTKELVGNKYGTPSPVPFRVVDQRAGIDIDIAIRCFGEYSYRITNPILFYTNVCGNVEEGYTRDEIDGQLKSELMTALQPAFAKISDMGIRYSALPGHTMELAEALNDVLSAKWGKLRGIEIVSFGVSSVKASEEDEQMLKEMQRNAAFMDPTRAAAHLVGAQASAMQTAATTGTDAIVAQFSRITAAAREASNASNVQIGASIPHNAGGTDNFEGGPTWMNEEGGELAILPGGSAIIPADQTDRLMKSYTNNTTNNRSSRSVSFAPSIQITIAGNADSSTVANLKEQLRALFDELYQEAQAQDYTDRAMQAGFA